MTDAQAISAEFSRARIRELEAEVDRLKAEVSAHLAAIEVWQRCAQSAEAERDDWRRAHALMTRSRDRWQGAARDRGTERDAATRRGAEAEGALRTLRKAAMDVVTSSCKMGIEPDGGFTYWGVYQYEMGLLETALGLTPSPPRVAEAEGETQPTKCGRCGAETLYPCRTDKATLTCGYWHTYLFRVEASTPTLSLPSKAGTIAGQACAS